MAVTTTGVAPASFNGVQTQSARIAENGAGTYNVEFTLPAYSVILDIIVTAEALWTAATSAALVVGDSADVDGYFTSTDLKATDLLAGESLSLGMGVGGAGGKGGAYLTYSSTTHVLRGPTAGNPTTTPLANTSDAVRVLATITSVGAGTAGRTLITVVFANAAGAPTITQ